MWCTNHSTEFAMPLYASECTSAGMSSIRTPPSPAPATPRRTASRSPSESAEHTHSASASEPIADSPETSPPPPRLAFSEPSASTVYETGPRLDATSTFAAPCVEAIRLNLARPGNAQTCGSTQWQARIRPVYDVYATRRAAYSAISTIGGRSSVSTEYVRGSNPSSPRSNWVREGRTRCPRASRSWAVR